MAFLALVMAAMAVNEPVISEFMASNTSGLQDADLSRPDWIEIHNPDTAPVNLEGWHLTDSATNKTKWRFPAVLVPADGYLVVFASGKDRRVVGQPLHTNFSLNADGEYLGLIKPDGVTVTSAFQPEFPPQVSNVSYGTPSAVASVTLMGPSARRDGSFPPAAHHPPPLGGPPALTIPHGPPRPWVSAMIVTLPA